MDLIMAVENADLARVKFQTSILTETMIATVTTEEDGFSDEFVVWSNDCEKLFTIIKSFSV